MAPAKTPTKPTKTPSRTVVADDLVITIDGKDFCPHAGETVTFRGSPSVSDSMVFMRYVAAGREFNAADATLTQVEELETLFERVLSILDRCVESWTWTDGAGKAYTSPPTIDDLRPLEPVELMWLIGALNTGEKINSGNV